MTGSAIIFDTSALIALERRKDRAMKVYTHARDRGLIVAAPNVTLAEWWRGWASEVDRKSVSSSKAPLRTSAARRAARPCRVPIIRSSHVPRRGFRIV